MTTPAPAEHITVLAAYFGLLVDGAVIGVMLGVPLGIGYLIWRILSGSMKKQRDRQTAHDVALATARTQYDAAVATFFRSFEGWESTCSPYDQSFLAVNNAQKKLALGRMLQAKTYDFAAVVAVEGIKDGATFTVHRDQPTSPLFFQDTYFETRALLRAIESPTTEIPTVRQLALNITVDDPVTPLYTVTFFRANAPGGADARSDIVVAALRQADVFRAFLTNIVRGNQKTTTDVVPQDITDRLQKLWELKEAGALSDDEFAAQKARLLSPG